MSTKKKVLIGYFIVTSLIFHMVFAFALYQIVSAMKVGFELGNEFARASAGQATNTGVIADVCTIQEGGYTYNGFAIDYKGQTLYAMGSASQGIKKGDTVAVTITKHPYGPLKDLMVTISKNGP